MRLPAIVKLSQTIRRHRDDILAAVELRLSNSMHEGLKSKIRLINHRGYGHHTAAALVAMIYLRADGITVQLPGEENRTWRRRLRRPQAVGSVSGRSR